MDARETPTTNGKWVVLVMFAVAIAISVLRWVYIPRTNPRVTDPGSPFYSPPRQGESYEEPAKPPTR